MSAIRPSRRGSQASPIVDDFADPSRTPDFVEPSADQPDQPSRSLAERRAERRARKQNRDSRLDHGLSAAVPRERVRRAPFPWRIISGVLVIALLISLLLIFTQRLFVISTLYVSYTDPQEYLTPAELFGRTGLDGANLFTIKADQVQQTLEHDPQIAAASVQISWPNIVQVTVTERQPVLIWMQANQKVWVDVTGHVMAIRRDLPLVQVSVQNAGSGTHIGACQWQGMRRVLTAGDCIDSNTVSGILQFVALYPSVTQLVYDPVKGLGYHDGRNWMLWFGDGQDMSTKMAVYNTIVAYILNNNLQPTEINVANPDVPYYNAVSALPNN